MYLSRRRRLSALAAALFAALVVLSAVPAAALTGPATALTGADAPAACSAGFVRRAGQRILCGA